MQKFEPMFFNTYKQVKDEKAIRVLKKTKSTPNYTHKCNLHLRDTTWEVLKLISQWTQDLKKNIRVALLLSQEDFTNLAGLSNFTISLDNTINGSDNTTKHVRTNLLHESDTMDIIVAQTYLSPTNKAKIAGLCFQRGNQGHIIEENPYKLRTKQKRTDYEQDMYC